MLEKKDAGMLGQANKMNIFEMHLAAQQRGISIRAFYREYYGLKDLTKKNNCVQSKKKIL